MEEHNQENVTRESVEDNLETIYHEYDGKSVAIQLKKEYFGVVAPNCFFVHPEAQEPARIPVLMGKLKVLFDGRNLRFQLKGPNPVSPEETLTVLFSPDDCAYISFAEEKSRIL